MPPPPGNDLSVVIPVIDERDNLGTLLPRLAAVLARIGCSSEIIVVDGGSRDGTPELAATLGARVVRQRSPGYGNALREGFAVAAGEFILTLDADLSHDPDFVAKLWRARGTAEIVIASRYVRAGMAYMPLHRRLLSQVLNLCFARALGVPIRDLSSGYRLYRASVLHGLQLEGRDFDLLEEVVVKAYADGRRVIEVPFTYFPRDQGTSHARIVRVGVALLRAFARLWPLRNSVESADYDERAFYSRIPLQRYWQRRRHRIVTGMARGAGRTLDVGCGSSVILQTLNDAVGLDVQARKLRYMRRYGVPLVQGSIFTLPFRAESFACVVCSQVIEHLPPDPRIFTELVRVLRPGGLLILGTPDYDTVGWRVIEPLYGFFAPGGYKDEHITHYSATTLCALAAEQGLETVGSAYVLGSEFILALRRPAASAPAQRDALAAGSRSQ